MAVESEQSGVGRGRRSGGFRATIAPMALVSAGCASGGFRAERLPAHRVHASSARSVLQPGDVLFRYVDPADPLDSHITSGIIQGGQHTAQSISVAVNWTAQAVRDLLRVEQDRFTAAIAVGDPNAVHMAIYLGDGHTAEAFGTNLENAGVNVWNLFASDRVGTAWRVLRLRDRALAARLVEVSRRWATGRMTYRVPMEVFVRDAAWGAGARRSALEFAQSFDRAAGPAGYTNMFCSQFVVAALQSAAARHYLTSQGASLTESAMDRLPREARIDAVASPLRVYTEWSSNDAFERVARVVVEPEPQR